MTARNPCSFAAIAMESAPRTPITLPDSESSPTAATPASACASITPVAVRMASAMGRS